MEGKQEHIESYLSKDEFITMLSNLRFKCVLRAHINFITEFEYDLDKNITRPLGFDINLEWGEKNGY